MPHRATSNRQLYPKLLPTPIIEEAGSFDALADAPVGVRRHPQFIPDQPIDLGLGLFQIAMRYQGAVYIGLPDRPEAA